MIVSRNPKQALTFGLMPVALLCAMVVQPVGVTVAQDMRAVSSRLEAAGKKIRAAAESGEYGPYEAIAKWHEIKEKIVTGAIAGDEISEAQARILRIEMVKAEAREMAETTSLLVDGQITAAQVVGYLDKNGDGKISKDEASKELKPHFEQIDANNDGLIDVKEAQVMADYASAQMRGTDPQTQSDTDHNHDGKAKQD